MEIMSLLSFGFEIKNIDSIDLISSSPHIRVGDMHDPCFFPQNHYDVILLSWVLNYSSQPEVVLKNALQSLKPRGVIALGNTHTEELTDLNLSSISSVDNLLIMIPLLQKFTTLLSVDSSHTSKTFMYVGQAPD
jgi:2-polyprenyl-3-methyl-5-hydroxy-6-metoxy-1,4-benzoquinol methylase